MCDARTLTRHAQLVSDMTRAVGVDLPHALAEGQITGAGMQQAVIRCTECTQAGACQRLLAAMTVPAEAPPDYCRNTALFKTLKDTPLLKE